MRNAEDSLDGLRDISPQTRVSKIKDDLALLKVFVRVYLRAVSLFEELVEGYLVSEDFAAEKFDEIFPPPPALSKEEQAVYESLNKKFADCKLTSKGCPSESCSCECEEKAPEKEETPGKEKQGTAKPRGKSVSADDRTKRR